MWNWLIPGVIGSVIGAALYSLLVLLISKIPRVKVSKPINVPLWIFVGMCILIIIQMFDFDSYIFEKYVKNHIPKEQFIDKEFRSQTIVLDGKEFIGCDFYKCELILKGMAGIKISKSHFSNSDFAFSGPAANTISFLHKLYYSGSGGKENVERIFENIRLGRVKITYKH